MHVPPNSVLITQKSWYADTARYFLESDRVLQFPHHSYQRSSRAGRLCVFLPASCGSHRQSSLHLILYRLRKRFVLLHCLQRNLHGYKADFPLSVFLMSRWALILSFFNVRLQKPLNAQRICHSVRSGSFMIFTSFRSRESG